MSEGGTERVTRILAAIKGGVDGAENELIEELYGELRRIARRLMKGQPPGHTIQPTDLVNEAYLRFGGSGIEYQDRAHFLSAAAKAMRWVLADHARERGRKKRGGDRDKEPLDSVVLPASTPQPDHLALHSAIERLDALDSEAARIVDLRFYSGCTSQQVSQILGISERTERRKWAHARAWLKRELT